MASKCVIILLIVVALNASICCNASVLGTRETLKTGDSLQNNEYVLTMQEDCNLVLHDRGNPIWATDTGGLASGCYCIMQDDGNLVVYSSPSKPIWASNTGGKSGGYFVLVLQNDRNLVIYGNPIWHTDTAKNAANSAPMFIPKIINANQTDSIIRKVTSTV
jgi:hypothetical protein